MEYNITVINDIVEGGEAGLESALYTNTVLFTSLVFFRRSSHSTRLF